jgi:hypothetical protein
LLRLRRAARVVFSVCPSGGRAAERPAARGDLLNRARIRNKPRGAVQNLLPSEQVARIIALTERLKKLGEVREPNAAAHMPAASA